MVFVDDRPKNLGPAQALGMTVVLFDNVGDSSPTGFPVVVSGFEGWTSCPSAYIQAVRPNPEIPKPPGAPPMVP